MKHLKLLTILLLFLILFVWVAQTATATQMSLTVNLSKEFNLINYTSQSPLTAYEFIQMLGDDAEIKSIKRFNKLTGKYETVKYNGSGEPDGDNFAIVNGEGYIVYSKVIKSESLIFERDCSAIDLSAGMNLVGLSCLPEKITAFQLLQAIGDETVASSIQRFNAETGKFETASYLNGQPAGVNFPVKAVEGYFIFMKQDIIFFPDNISPPDIQITSPADNSTVSSSPISVSGTIDDANAQVTVNGINASITGNTFTAIGVPLVEGQNMITAIAIDQFGNSATDSITVTLCTICIIKPVVTDDGIYTTSPVELHATWTFIDPGINIVEYQYAIGTSAGSTDVVDWTSAGIQTEITHTGLSLIQGQTYYISVRGMDAFGRWSDVGTSDGIKINQHIPRIIDIQPADGSSGYALDSINFSVNAQDGDGDVLSYQFSLDGQVIQLWQSTPDFFWSTTDVDLGVHSIKIEVSDNNGGEVSQNIGICLFRRPPAPPVP
ncbi:MAG: hypothetical protein HZA14_13400 [Nitrospirae bacterium]|nr:hypothetical protein [Nitrospirota bacterium]